METAIRMRGVEKRYGAKVALQGFDLEVQRGRVVGLLGLNGAGKSTSMRLMCGLLKANAGELEVLGRDPWRSQPEERRRIGYLSEDHFPFPDLDLRGAVAFVSRFHRTWDEAYAAHLVELLRIPAGIPYRALSRGQQRKLHLLLTLAPKPELLLLDDPAQGLDVAVRRELVQSLLPLLEEQGSTVVFSSHVFSDIQRLADGVAIVHEGRVRLTSDMDRLKERAVQILVPGRVGRELRGTLAARPHGTSTLLTLFDPDRTELEQLRARHRALQERPVTLEDLFLELVQGAAAEEPV